MKNILVAAAIAAFSLSIATQINTAYAYGADMRVAMANKTTALTAKTAKYGKVKKVKRVRPVPVIKLPPTMTQTVRQTDRRFFNKAISSYRNEFRRRGVRVNRTVVIQFPDGQRKTLKSAKKHRKRKAKSAVNKEQATRNRSQISTGSRLNRTGGTGASPSILKKPSTPTQTPRGGWRRGQNGLPRGVQINLGANTIKTFQVTGKMRPTPRRRGG